ncbi:hypothetical protein BJL95_02640 [Methylomonas sp. LWB]|nr:hypothetical protein BJL95_02640 [Methylomonas sp. LWB]
MLRIIRLTSSILKDLPVLASLLILVVAQPFGLIILTFPDSKNMHMFKLRKAKLWLIRMAHRVTKEKGVWII